MWTPLEHLIGRNRCGEFMYMGDVPSGIHQYKNINTRRYLNIDDSGRTYKYLHMAGAYVTVPADEAITHVFS